jgi:hypothetical protein
MSKTYPFSIYSPASRFVEMSKWEFTETVWSCLTKTENVEQMESAIDDGKSPLLPMDSELNSRFSQKIIDSNHDEEELRIMCLNMMKQLLEFMGYEHTACALIRDGEFVKSAGIYKKIDL